MACCICLEEFPDWKLNNPRYCCSAKLCQSCSERTRSCPQCRHQADRDQDQSLNLDDEVTHLQTATFRCYTSEASLHLEWLKDGKLDRKDGPAVICYCDSGQIDTVSYYTNDMFHRTDGRPAYIRYYRSPSPASGAQIMMKQYYKDGKLDRTDGPASIQYYESGQLHEESYHNDGKRHDADGPSYTLYYESGQIQLQQYYKGGRLARTDGPASILYYESGQIQKELYYKDGKLDRTDGPASISYHESGQIQAEYYYKDGKQYPAHVPVNSYIYELERLSKVKMLAEHDLIQYLELVLI